MSDATASAIIALTIAILAGLAAGIFLTLSRISSEDYGTVRRSRHQGDSGAQRRASAGLGWIPDPHPRRTKGQLITWAPDDDPPDTYFPLDPEPDPDYRAGDHQ